VSCVVSEAGSGLLISSLSVLMFALPLLCMYFTILLRIVLFNYFAYCFNEYTHLLIFHLLTEINAWKLFSP